MTSTLIVGGSGGLGGVIAQYFADRGDDVIITSRDKARAETVAAGIGVGVRGWPSTLPNPKRSAPRWLTWPRSTTLSSPRSGRPRTRWRSSTSLMP